VLEFEFRTGALSAQRTQSTIGRQLHLNGFQQDFGFGSHVRVVIG
jgi:hypothetical protein